MKFKEKIEAGVVVFARTVIPILPRIVVYRLSRIAGFCIYVFTPKLRNVAAANIELVFGNSKLDAEKRRINIASLQSIVLTTLDVFWFSKNTVERVEKYMSYDDSFSSILDNQSSIILSAHFGSWEMIGLCCGANGHKLTSIAMPIKNPYVDRVLNVLRGKVGAIVTARKGGVRTVLKALKKGRGTALLIDQNTLPEEGGVFVPFFGLPVPVANVTGIFQSVVNSKVFIAWCFADEKGCYKAYAKPPFVPSDDMSSEDVTAHVTRELESVIHEYPDYWLWAYKRWCFYRESDDKEKYPFYAESYEEYSEYSKLVKKYRMARDAVDEANKVLMEFEEND